VRVARKVEIIVACAIVPCLLEMFPARHVLSWIRRLPARRADAVPPDRLALHVDRLLMRAPAFWHHTCLRRAATLAALLRRTGWDVVVAIGVRRSAEGALEAHAWIERDGQPWLEGAGSSEGFVKLG
jgi:hypothetical protein